MKKGQITPAVIIAGLLAASVPVSLYTTSVFIGCLTIYWVIDGVPFQNGNGFINALSVNGKLIFQGLNQKLKLFIHNPAAVVFAFLYLLYLMGCLWSSNSYYSLQDLREKSPLLILPVIFSGLKPFTDKEFRQVLIAFIMGVVLGTLLGVYIYLTRNISDTRELSPYMPHIRFSMNICLAIFIVFRFMVKGNVMKLAERIGYLFLFFWLIGFLFILKSITGILIFAGFLIYVMIYFSLRLKRLWLRNTFIAFTIIIPLLISSYIYNIYSRHFNIAPVDLSALATKTPLGNRYLHDTVHFKVENGQYVGLYLCEEELKQNWEKRSRLSYTGRNLQGDELRYTIIRYLNSKGYRKDALGLSKLTTDDITNIEKGVANAGLIQPFNFSARIEGFFTDYDLYMKTGNANGKSELQKLEYWKTAMVVLRQNWLTGVGTGDVTDAFTREYENSHSKLEVNFRGTSHNQYIYMGIAFGIGGLLFFIFWLIYPPLYLNAFRDYYFVALFCIMIFSMLTEDTIRHQAGLNFMAFFGALFLFGRERKQTTETR